jgi:hypothetical protein
MGEFSQTGVSMPTAVKRAECPTSADISAKPSAECGRKTNIRLNSTLLCTGDFG